MNHNRIKKPGSKGDILWIIYLWIMAVVIISGLIFNVNRAIAGEVLRVKSRAIVEGEKILLKDIADTKNPLIMDIILGQSPDPSKSINLSGYKIAAIIRSNKLPKDLSIEIPQNVTVTRSYQSVDPKRVENFFLNELEKKLKKNQFRVKNLKVRGLKNYPKGVISFRTSFNGEDLTGHTVQKIDVLVDGKLIDKASVISWIDRIKMAVALSRSMKRNAVIKESDVELKEINISRHRSDYFTDIEDVTGKKIKRSLRRGSFISPGSVERAPVIAKGSMVRIIAKIGNLVVETIGKAKNDGFKGETIFVENISSKKTVAGKVVDKTTVSAFF